MKASRLNKALGIIMALAMALPMCPLAAWADSSLPQGWSETVMNGSTTSGQTAYVSQQSSSFANGKFTVAANRGKIQSTTPTGGDTAYFLNVPVSGDFTMTARVATVGIEPGNTAINTENRAILMVKDGVTNESNSLSIFLKPTSVAGPVTGAIAGYRRFGTDVGAATTTPSSITANAPVYLKMEKTGNTYKAFYAMDGISFSQFYSRTDTLNTLASPTLNVGLAVTAATVEFDNVSIVRSDGTAVFGTAAPQNVLAASGNGSVTVSWNAVSGANSYTLSQSTNATGPFTPVSSATNIQALSASITGLVNGTKYYYAVTANGTNGSTSSAIVNATPALPAPAVPAVPTGLAAASGNAHVGLTWNTVTDATYYMVKRGTATNGPFSLIATSVTAAAYDDFSVTNGNTYYYVVNAVNATGSSANSASVSATPSAAPATVPVDSIQVTSSGGSSISTKNGTLQMSAAVLPNNAANAAVDWSVYEADGVTATDKATISSSGLLQAVKDGTVKVTAKAKDASGVSGSSTITISGQTPAPVIVPNVTLTGLQQASSGQLFSSSYGLSNVAASVYKAIYTQDVTFQYDANVLTFVSAESLKSGFSLSQIITDTPGQVRIVAGVQGPADAVTADGELIKLNWQAKNLSQPGTGLITVTSAKLSNNQSGQIEATTASLSIQVTAVNKSSLQTLIASVQAAYNTAVEGTHNGQYPAGSKAILNAAIAVAATVASDASASQQQMDAAVLQLNQAFTAFQESRLQVAAGDVSGNGIINVGDVGIVSSVYGLTSSSPDWSSFSQADVNNDGVINDLDLAFIADIILK
ncbi:dockerin type I domain-containing protein [Paenibacillus radicis (ex Xue et al. 2023)]|uniref:Ig-like domain-containing protein n=1 Tax=Paenibacillus radicis (ex Xue et al. 2023) TaxID=2972489 RepID=A0ABT1YR97_9BACL|nr:dockerin type I domain-containing protein [Paenibacillus radicis (ex Xue et al. 2023)]MCR8635710.1 Ig-like domain-containing protein [Paenibacillus radicis (ex Xue et al. 2023)]